MGLSEMAAVIKHYYWGQSGGGGRGTRGGWQDFKGPLSCCGGLYMLSPSERAGVERGETSASLSSRRIIYGSFAAFLPQYDKPFTRCSLCR